MPLGMLICMIVSVNDYEMLRYMQVICRAASTSIVIQHSIMILLAIAFACNTIGCRVNFVVIAGLREAVYRKI